MINIRSAKQMDLARIETIYNHIHDEEVGIVPCVFNGIPDTLVLLHAAISLSPCSPMMKEWTLRLSTPKCSLKAYFKRAVSKTVPEPMTRFSGKPESFNAA